MAFPDLMVTDEIRYPAGHPHRGQALLPSHERALRTRQQVLTSYKGFEHSCHVFGDEVMAGALSTGSCATATSSTSRGNSYRMWQHRELAHRLLGAQPRTLPPPHGHRPAQ